MADVTSPPTILSDGPVRVTIDFPSRLQLFRIAREQVDGKPEKERELIIERLVRSQFGQSIAGGSAANSLFAPLGKNIDVKVYDPTS